MLDQRTPAEASTGSELALALTLVAVAGATDAIGFLKLSHLFVSFMSGNSTQFAIALARGHGEGAFEAGVLIAVFVIGAALGRAIFRLTGTRYRAVLLALDAIFLAMTPLIATGHFITIVPLPLAMGLQNGAVRMAGDTKTNLTYVTGTLVRFADTLVDALFGERTPWASYGLMWLALIGGAIIGSLLFGFAGLEALFAPAAICAGLATYSATRRRA